MTEADVINDALTLLGEPRTAGPAGANQPTVRRCVDVLPAVARTVLEDHDWTFATKWIELTAPSADFEPGDYAYAFRKPGDWLRTVEVSRYPDRGRRAVEDPWEDRSGHILSGFAPTYLWFVSSEFVDRYGAWSAKMAYLVSCEIASRVVPATSEKQLTLERIDMALKKARADAKTANARNTHIRGRAPGRLYQARRSGNGMRGLKWGDYS